MLTFKLPNFVLSILTVSIVICYTKAANSTYRLPGTLLPTSYNVDLLLNTDIFDTNIFDGTVEIAFNTITNSTDQSIKLHANGINITAASLHHNNQSISIPQQSFVSDSTTEILEIQVNQMLNGDGYVLTLIYTGLLRDDVMNGFYKSSYQDDSGNTKYLATTQFQATHARKAFPCFDEPALKATFNISITYPIGYNALANSPITSTNIVTTSLQRSTFATTPKMSTYLVAFTVSEFTCSSGEDIQAGVIPYQVCSRNEANDTRQLALDLGPHLLRDLESYTAINYSESGMGKMDQVAIPDFAAGAMENWGLVTYRETAILWDTNESSNTYKQRVATVIAHEFAHMWFGNLITLKWWSDVFLNEGFATYFEYFTTHSILPKWELDKQFVIKELQEVLQTDASITAKALSVETASQSEISSRFSSIAYNKGGSIFRMVEHFMGSDKFQLAIREYLSLNKNSNTEPEDLWNTLNSRAVLPNSKNLTEVMQNWTIKAGFPLVTVEYSNSTITLSQKRFLLSDEDDTKWYVPISYTKSTDSNKFVNTSAMAWLTPDGNLTITEDLTNVEWIIFNNQQSAYYRVNYDDDLWTKILSGLNKENFDEIHVLNRAQIIDDLFNLAKIGKITYLKLLNSLTFLSKDVEYYTWYSALSGFSYMLRRTGNDALRALLSTYILNLEENFYRAVPFDQEDPDNQVYTLKQVLAVTWACNLGHSECISRATYEYNKYKSTSDRPSKNLRGIIYCTGLRNSIYSVDDWNFLWNQFLSTKIATEQVTILSALGCTKNETILNDYLSKSISSSSGIRQQDALSAFASVYTGNSEGVDIALDFFIKNYDNISTYYASMNSISSLISGLATRFTKQEQITKLENFVSTGNVAEDVVSIVEEALTSARINLAWTQSLENELLEYFAIVSSGNLVKISLVSLFAAISLIFCHL